MEKQPDTIGTPGEHGTEREASATVHVTHTAQTDTVRSEPGTLPPAELGAGISALVLNLLLSARDGGYDFWMRQDGLQRIVVEIRCRTDK